MENLKASSNELREQVLSPEIIERIMEKVIDIETKGTAYTSTRGFSAKQVEDDLWRKWTKEVIDPLIKENMEGKLSGQETDEKISLGIPDFRKQVENAVAQQWASLKERIRTLLRHGIIGIAPEDSGQLNREEKPIKEKYVEKIKSHRASDHLVYANIVGRTETYSDVYDAKKKVSSTEIGNSYWMRGEGFGVAIIFDKDFFDEVEPKVRESRRTIIDDKWTFNSDDLGTLKAYEKTKALKSDIGLGDEILRNQGRTNSPGRAKAFDEEGLPKPWEEYGFVFFPRIPKRALRGLVVKMPKDDLREQRLKELFDLFLEVNKNNPELLIPIYDTDGNLLWPGPMSYQQVKKLVTDRSR